MADMLSPHERSGMNDKVFVDTNILIYAHDTEAGYKREKAAETLLTLWDNRQGILSTQVLQEFYVNVTRKIPQPLKRSTARDVIERYSVWPVVSIDTPLILRASNVEEQHQLSFWDALIVAAAQQSNATKLLSEDLNNGQRIGGLVIENPFA